MQFQVPDLTKWYWVVGGVDTRVFSSAASAYVPATDPAYVAWRDQSGIIGPTPIDSENSLSAVLAPLGLYLGIGTLQASLCSDIDSQAETQRLRYITPGEAQMATYLLKRGQAMQALAAQAANTTANMTADALAAAYPYLANEIGITVDPTSKTPATDVYGVARAVQAIAAVWQGIDLAIERARLATKAAISAATTVAAAQAAHDAVAWPAPPLP